jgi:signal transduction histidine kinase
MAVAVAVLIQITGHQDWRAPEVAHIIGYSLVYANLCGVLSVLLVGALAQKPVLRLLPLAPLVTVAIVVSAAIGCLLAQTLLLETNLATAEAFWGEYWSVLRTAIPLGLVFGAGALAHASLRTRAHDSEAKLREKEASEERTHKLMAEARLHSLESRIHPHFLFNTLNAIGSLIPVDAERAERTLERLSTLLRASLDNATQPLIPLRQELSIVESYLDIQNIRFGSTLRTSVTVPTELQELKVPPFSVQTLVENAVKHGITPSGNGREILVTASVVENRLRVEVRDSGPGFDLTALRAGHGLDNLVSRLDALFGAEARFDVNRSNGLCVTEIVLPLV